MLTAGDATLPIELVIVILQELTYKDVLSCRAVSRSFLDVVDMCTALQYKIKLAITAMIDNPHNPMSLGQKLALLRQYADAWAALSMKQLDDQKTPIPLQDGPAWELTGGVLAQSIGPNEIEFRQLPSRIRGIEGSSWSTHISCAVRDFSMDPGQDLLVVVEAQPSGSNQGQGSVRLLSMQTGQKHPLAPQAQFYYDREGFPATSYEIRISGQYVGLLVLNSRATESEVSIWDWKQGTRVYIDTGTFLTTFVFMNDQYALICKDESVGSSTDSAALYLVDLSTASRRRCRRKFYFPELADADSVQGLELLCEPGTIWAQTNSQAAPFHFSQDERLIILKMNLPASITVTFAFLASSLLTFANDETFVENDFRVIPWSEWGYRHCRAELAPQWHGTWPCVVYGTKYVDMYPDPEDDDDDDDEDDEDDEGDTVKMSLVVQDYNQLMIRHTLSASKNATDASKSVLFTDETTVEMSTHEIYPFARTLRTSLPFVEITIPFDLTYRDEVMMSEDSIVVVKNATNMATEFHVYSF